MGGDLKNPQLSERTKVYTGTWNSNYQSWKSFNQQNKYLLIKYEDLTKKKEETFIEILNFIYELQNNCCCG